MATASSVTNTLILFDDREASVGTALTHIKETTASNKIKHITLSRYHLTTGDFSIIRGKELAAVIERKTLSDLAASIKDNRIRNNDKLIAKRTAKQCDVILIIEGDVSALECISFDFTSTTRTNGINNQALISHINNAQVRDKIYVYYTRDHIHTANKLMQLAYAYSRDSNYVNKLSTPLPVTGGDVNELATDMATSLTLTSEPLQVSSPSQPPSSSASPPSSSTSPSATSDRPQSPLSSIISTLTEPRSDQSIYTAVLLELSGITRANVSTYLDYTLRELVNTAEDDINSIPITLPTRIKKSLIELSNNPAVFWRSIKCIPNVSDKFAEAMFVYGYKDFININANKSKMLATLGQKECSIISKIYHFINFKRQKSEV